MGLRVLGVDGIITLQLGNRGFGFLRIDYVLYLEQYQIVACECCCRGLYEWVDTGVGVFF